MAAHQTVILTVINMKLASDMNTKMGFTTFFIYQIMLFHANQFPFYKNHLVSIRRPNSIVAETSYLKSRFGL